MTAAARQRRRRAMRDAGYIYIGMYLPAAPLARELVLTGNLDPADAEDHSAIKAAFDKCSIRISYPDDD